MAELGDTIAELRGEAGELLLERDAAMAAIVEGLGAAERGAGTTLFLAGTAGIGKTSLIGAGERAACVAGFTVAGAVGSPMEADLPFGLVGQAIVALGGSDVEDVVELERLGGQPREYSVHDLAGHTWSFGTYRPEPAA